MDGVNLSGECSCWPATNTAIGKSGMAENRSTGAQARQPRGDNAEETDTDPKKLSDYATHEWIKSSRFHDVLRF